MLNAAPLNSTLINAARAYEAVAPPGELHPVPMAAPINGAVINRHAINGGVLIGGGIEAVITLSTAFAGHTWRERSASADGAFGLEAEAFPRHKGDAESLGFALDSEGSYFRVDVIKPHEIAPFSISARFNVTAGSVHDVISVAGRGNPAFVRFLTSMDGMSCLIHGIATLRHPAISAFMFDAAGETGRYDCGEDVEAQNYWRWA